MIEDKLRHDERLRLECLAQSVARNMGRPSASDEQVIQTASAFESFVKGH